MYVHVCDSIHPGNNSTIIFLWKYSHNIVINMVFILTLETDILDT